MTNNASDRPGDLRALRRHAGLSQRALADLAGCSIAIIALLEKGYRPARSSVLPRLLAILQNGPPQTPRVTQKALARALGLSADDLLLNDNEAPVTAPRVATSAGVDGSYETE